jgi:hypothetical protein
MGRILDFFSVAAPVADVDIKTRVNSLDADSPTGPVLAAGGSAAFTYVVTNTGNVPLSGVGVSDNNGTPGLPGDDFVPAFSGGDANSNNLLDVGETWIYTANRTVVAGQYSNTGSVAAVGNATNVSDTDAANYFGSAPDVNVETFVEGQDADLPTGPVLAAGSFATFTYELTNTGNVPLSNIVLIDNNSTLTPADDFTPVLSGGDTNSNNMLDLGETWTYSAAREVSPGQYHGDGEVSAMDSISQLTIDADRTAYFGAAPDVSLETLVNGEEADSPTGPNLVAGSNAMFTYVVTNTGNVALAGVVVSDDNGTPGNTADDFNPTITGGDTNSNNLLDIGETWTYSAARVVTVGQHTNQGSVTASDSLNQVVSSADDANHLGIAPENADFNGNTVVDAADYVVWRKFGGTTVPAGTLGDANGDTDVDEDDYLVFTEQFGQTSGGGGGDESIAEALTAEPSDTDSQDAAFSTLAANSVTLRASAQPTSRRNVRQAAAIVRDDWPAILAAIAERAAARDSDGLEVVGTCTVGRTKIEPARPSGEPGLARLQLIPRLKAFSH